MHDTTPLHVASPDDLVQAVLQMIGSTPHESLVLVGIDDTTITATVTVDLPAIALPGILPALVRSVARSSATGVIALVYSTTAANTAVLVEPLSVASDWARLELLAALRVDDGAVRPLAAIRQVAQRRKRARR
ncbi:DUF4192 family protein [uncultured Jatrophihabitans sp.]|uniref:DUF4192 family protein n=1 Tax=uncultured Jatrophihabitans sp. TaxID=1610747 RepID=UPI0035CA7619